MYRDDLRTRRTAMSVTQRNPVPERKVAGKPPDFCGTRRHGGDAPLPQRRFELVERRGRGRAMLGEGSPICTQTTGLLHALGAMYVAEGSEK